MLHEAFQGSQPALPLWVTVLPALLFWAVWLFCLVHCLRKQAFYPVFRRTGATRVFWVATFFLFSPALVVLYLVFGVLWPAKRKPVWWRSALVIVPALAMAYATLSGWMPRTQVPAITERDGNTGAIKTPAAPGFSFQLGVHRDQVNGSHTLITGRAGGSSLYSLSSVWIQEGGDHPIVRETARALHEKLSAYAPIQRIGWGPPGTMPPIGERTFDYYILLELPQCQVVRLPGYRTSRGVLRAETGTYPPGGRHEYRGPVSLPLVNCDGDSKLNFSLTHFGLETRLSGDQRLGRALAEDLFGQLEKNFDDLAEKHGPPAKLPDLLYGPMRDAPPMPFQDSVAVSVLQSGYGLLNHNHTVWRVESSEPQVAFMEGIQAAMHADGWRGRSNLGGDSKVSLQLEREEDRFWFVRADHDAHVDQEPAAPRVYYAHYIDYLAEDELRPRLEQFLASWPTADTAKAFASQFNAVGLGEAYQAYIEEYASGNTSAAITLAEQHAENGDFEAARAMVRRAEVFTWFEPMSLVYRERLEPLWETLGMERRSQGDVDLALLKELDAVFPEESLPVVREAPPGHLILFYWPGEPCLWGFRVVRSRMANHAWDLELVQMGRAMSSWGSSGFDWPEDSDPEFERNEYLSAGGQNIDLTITVRRLPDGLLRFTFAKSS